jgi:hypothetical protein
MRIVEFLVSIVVCLPLVVHALALSAPIPHRIFVVGKIIIDEYRAPNDDAAVISVGGGGPQAAWGAAAALAVWLAKDEDDAEITTPRSTSYPPPPQPVTFLGPVGMLDWTSDHEKALKHSIGDAVDSIHLVQGEGLQTPRIQLWHDEQQTIQWQALHDSFGIRGAETLWRNRPSCHDIRGLLVEDDPDETIAVHIILEVGADAPGGGDDALALLTDGELWERISFLGVEPVAFPQEGSDRVSIRDAQSCVERLTRLVPHLDYVSPDRNLFSSLSSYEDNDADNCLWNQVDVVTVRNGPEGSVVMENGHELGTSIPAATLHTPNGEPVNPTGAGNAYSAAFAACRAFGACSTEAACIASAIGAVVCEHEQLPPWSYEVLDRIREATMEIQRQRTSTTIGKEPPQEV